MESVLVEKGEIVYQKQRARWEKLYKGKIIAIEVESGSLAGVGDTLDEAYERALEEFPEKHFYFRKVGPHPAPTYLF